MSIQITEEMKEAAKREAMRRDPNIKHHFELEYMTGAERDIIGFVGEFACKTLFGIPWEEDIRDNYLQIDSGDIILPELTIDIKTETIPFSKLMDLVKGKISDDAAYGRRLINAGQMRLLEHYDYIVWGAIPREHPDQWYALGYLDTEYIRAHYPEPVTVTPFGSHYPSSCLNIRHSELKHVSGLKNLIAAHR